MPALRNGRPPYDIIWQVFADALSRRNISKQALREVALKILTYIEYYEMFLSSVCMAFSTFIFFGSSRHLRTCSRWFSAAAAAVDKAAMYTKIP